MKAITQAILLLLLAMPALSKGEENVIRSKKPITWLGLDFSLARIIGAAAQFGGAGEVTLDELKNKYMPGWNLLFLTEPKKYDVAKYVRRDAVANKLEVTAKDNTAVDKDIFSINPSDMSRLRKADIEAQVSKMDFMDQHGVGYVIFIEGMNKGNERASGWITFVDMDTKKVLQTHRAEGSPGGFGFRNYWAKAFLSILKDTDN